MVLGVDIGNYNVKTSERIIFPARYTTKESLLNNVGEELYVHGERYFICNGSIETKLSKAEKQNVLPLLYASIIKSTDESPVKIVCGLPVNQYKSNKEKFKSLILSNRMINLKFKDQQRTIILEDCEIFPEGAGAYFSLNDRPRDCIVLDIGGRTTNILLFENGKVKKAESLAMGMINIYSDVRDYINSRYTLDLSVEAIENVFKEGLWVDGEKIDMSFIKPILQAFIEELMNELQLNYPIRTHEILLTGGGSFILYSILQRKIKRIRLIDDYLFANAYGFRKVGLNIWKGEE